MERALYGSAARTTTPAAFKLSSRGKRGIVLIIDVTAVSATPSVTPTIAGYDRLSGKSWTLLAGAAITGTGTTVLTVYPGLTAAANVTANGVIPDEMRITMTHGDTDSITYTVNAYLLD